MGKKKQYYKKKMHEYEKAENTIAEKLEMVNDNLRQCDESFSDFPNVYEHNPAVEGQVIDNFYSKSEKFGNELKDILDKAKSSRDTIDNKKKLAHERYLHYRELYEGSSDDDDDDDD